jgi:hypothetical protein
MLDTHMGAERRELCEDGRDWSKTATSHKPGSHQSLADPGRAPLEPYKGAEPKAPRPQEGPAHRRAPPTGGPRPQEGGAPWCWHRPLSMLSPAPLVMQGV